MHAGDIVIPALDKLLKESHVQEADHGSEQIEQVLHKTRPHSYIHIFANRLHIHTCTRTQGIVDTLGRVLAGAFSAIARKFQMRYNDAHSSTHALQ